MPEIDPTIETWRVGNGDSVVTDGPFRCRGKLYDVASRGADEQKYYGGHLICEGIGTMADARLIAAAPEAWCAELRAQAIALLAEVKGQEGDDAKNITDVLK